MSQSSKRIKTKNKNLSDYKIMLFLVVSSFSQIMSSFPQYETDIYALLIITL